MATLSELQASQAAALTATFKSAQNRSAAKLAALIALYYQRYVDVENPQSIDRWIELMVPRIISTSDANADTAAAYYTALRRIELPEAESFRATASHGVIDEGVKKSLLTVGPYDMVNKMRDISRLEEVGPQQEQALIAEAKQVTTSKVAAAVVRHAQAGGRQTIHDASEEDRVALGWVRVTRAQPCYFCAMLASRGIHYRPFKEDSFTDSNARFSGEGDAKVHDECGCSLKPVFTTNDPLVDKTKQFADMWSMWSSGGGNVVARFRRGYEHWRDTGEFITWAEANGDS